jgi:hypothetical protein
MTATGILMNPAAGEPIENLWPTLPEDSSSGLSAELESVDDAVERNQRNSDHHSRHQ